jgi:hypothetical protein
MVYSLTPVCWFKYFSIIDAKPSMVYSLTPVCWFKYFHNPISEQDVHGLDWTDCIIRSHDIWNKLIEIDNHYDHDHRITEAITYKRCPS